MKKALSVLSEKQMVLILLGIVLIIVLSMLSNYFIAMKERADVQMCKNSVYAHAGLKLGPIDFSNRITCPTKEVIIDTDKKEIAMRQISDAMARCWDMFGKGRLNLFEEGVLDRKYCHLCNQFVFESDIKNIGLDEFFTFLNTEEYNSGHTYLSFITSNKGTDIDMSMFPEGFRPIIDFSKTYGIIFLYDKPSNSFIRRTVGVVSGAALGTVGVVLALKGGLISLSGIGSVVGVPAAAAGVALTGTAGYMIADSFEQRQSVQSVLLVPLNTEYIDELECGYLEVKGEKGK